MFYFSGLSFWDTQRVWVFGSEFSRHPRVWVFRVWGVSSRGLSFRDTLRKKPDKPTLYMHYTFVWIIQVSKNWVQTCLMNFYCSNDQFLNLQFFFFTFLCCISPHHFASCQMANGSQPIKILLAKAWFSLTVNLVYSHTTKWRNVISRFWNGLTQDFLGYKYVKK